MTRHVPSLSLLVLLLLLNGIEVVVMIGLVQYVSAHLDSPEPSSSLPCAAIPRKFIQDDPRCANKLLESMNVTNVRITDRLPGLDEEAAAHIDTLCERVGAHVAPSFCGRGNTTSSPSKRAAVE